MGKETCTSSIKVKGGCMGLYQIPIPVPECNFYNVNLNQDIKATCTIINTAMTVKKIIPIT